MWQSARMNPDDLPPRVEHAADVIEFDGSRIAVDNEGYLLDPRDWSPRLAEWIAADIGVDMSDRHWAVVYFVRHWYRQHESVPEARRVLKMLASEFGNEAGSRKALYALFPYGYGQQACRIAGMRKPLKLMLDV